MIPNWVPFFGGTSDTSEPSTGESDESSVEYDGAQTPLDSLADSHQSLVAPENVVERASGVEMGERWRQTLWVAEYPDEPIDGLFETLYSTGETRETDISIHLDPRDTHSTLNELENRIEPGSRPRVPHRETPGWGTRRSERSEDYQALYDVLRNTSMRAFDVSMYLSARGERGARLSMA